MIERADMLTVVRARQNNLRGVSLSIPLGAWVTFVGVSGSGKSSMAFDTLHREGQRRYLEALSSQIGRRSRGLRRPDVDAIRHLPPTVALDQRASAPPADLPLGDLVEVLSLVRLLCARAGVQRCPGCDRVVEPRTHEAMVEALMAAPVGARLVLEAPIGGAGSRISTKELLDEVARAGFSRVSVGGVIHRVEEMDLRTETAVPLRVVVDRIRMAADRRPRVHDAVRTAARAGRGVVVAVWPTGEEVFVDRPVCAACGAEFPRLDPSVLSWQTEVGRCPVCAGTGEIDGAPCATCGGCRLGPVARSVWWGEHSLPVLAEMGSSPLREVLEAVPGDEVSAPVLDELIRRLAVIEELGLGHLSLMRRVGCISSGELQRLRLAGQVGAQLSGVLYVLDEPAAGLHGEEVRAVSRLLGRLRDAGNTLVVVEHHPDVVRASDWVVEFGPGAGASGGDVVFTGPPDALAEAGTVTGDWLSGRRSYPAASGRLSREEIVIDGTALPVGVLAAVFGPSGSGKSRLLSAVRTGWDELRETSAFARCIDVGAGSVARHTRSNPATYVGLWGVLRELLASTREARVRGFAASFFSFNVKGGRCEACRGTGQQRVDLEILPDVWLVCDVCGGRRFHGDVLEVRWKGYSADDFLRMRVEDARPVLSGHPKLEAMLRALVDVGLGYLLLGQPLHTLSGGEARRLKLARELVRMARGGGADTLILLDDPTVGLHPQDRLSLLVLLRRLVEEGATVWVATHDRPFAEACDACVCP